MAKRLSRIERDIERLKEKISEYQQQLKELEAWHNYYPRRNTGLDVRFFEARNNWLKAHGVRSAAFFAGCGLERTVPLFAQVSSVADYPDHDVWQRGSILLVQLRHSADAA